MPLIVAHLLSRVVIGMTQLMDSGHENHPRFRAGFHTIFAEMTRPFPLSPTEVSHELAAEIAEF